MKLKRALELCEEPIKKTKSHMVRVNRFALTHALADRNDRVNEIGRLQGEASQLRQKIDTLDQFQQFILAGLDKAAIDVALEAGRAKVEEAKKQSSD
jgi:hypothetical protein